MADPGEVKRIIDDALEGLFDALDRIGATPNDVVVADTSELAEWYQTWIWDSESDPTADVTTADHG